jgi:molybdate transport system substrate-binding protein
VRALLKERIRVRGTLVPAVTLGLFLLHPQASLGRDRLVVAAASSLTEAVVEISTSFEMLHSEVQVLATFSGSGVHRVQIERGAPIDVLVFASPTQVAPLVASGRVAPNGPVIVAGNELVLVARKTATFHSFDELRALDGLLVAAGDPVRVPAGEYAARLFSARHWDLGSGGRLVPAENVRQVLRYVETGAVAAGFVYRTDVLGSDTVIVVESYGPEAVGEIEIVAAPLSRTRLPDEAAEFVRFLRSASASRIWAAHGFLPPPDEGAPPDVAPSATSAGDRDDPGNRP